VNKDYNAKDIEVLEGLEAVRLRPGMYIGTTGAKGLHHILWEIVDNALDEICNGFGTRVDIVIYPDGSVSVEDDGRGIPVDKHPTLGISGVEVVFTQLHAGGKFNNENYTFSGGLHGVGASVTNALSEWLDVTVYKNGKVYKQEFHSPEVNGKIQSGIPRTSLTETGEKTKKHGTYVRFMPDKRVFGKELLSYQTIIAHVQEQAFLNKGITITVEDKRQLDDDLNSLKSTFCYERGLSDFVQFINNDKQVLYAEPIEFEVLQDRFYLGISLQHTMEFSERTFSFVNSIPTNEGGTHEVGFKSALTKVMNDYARKRGLLKDKDANLQGEDFREGLTCVLSVRMQNVQFEGQTKTKLGNPEIRPLVEGIVMEKLDAYLSEKKHFDVGDKIVEKALGAAKVREAAKKAKDLARQKNNANTNMLIGKLANCTGKKPELNELFIVEGDSAGGSAKQGRDRRFQAILPLRGKPINAEKKRIEQLLDNEEICTIIGALGANFDTEFNINALKFGKVIILADADQDGAHIRSILLTFFFRYMKELITDGHLYIGMPPLYKVEKKDVIRYGYDDAALDKIIEEVGRNYKLQRYKGLGEMNPEQLWETTLNPETRCLTRVSIDDAAAADKMISTLMGDNVDSRKAYIYQFANFNRKDEIEKKGYLNV